MSCPDDCPSLETHIDSYQVPIQIRKLLAWRDRCLLIVEEGYYIGYSKNGIWNDSSKKTFYNLYHAKIVLEKDPLVISIIHYDNKDIQIRFKSNEAKMEVINKMNEVIYKISEKNAFSDDYVNQEKEIRNIRSLFGDRFDSVIRTFKRFQNLFNEINQKINTLIKMVDDCHIKYKPEKDEFVNIAASIFCIKEEMKKQFDFLVKVIFEYRNELTGSEEYFPNRSNSLFSNPTSSLKLDNDDTKIKILESLGIQKPPMNSSSNLQPIKDEKEVISNISNSLEDNKSNETHKTIEPIIPDYLDKSIHNEEENNIDSSKMDLKSSLYYSVISERETTTRMSCFNKKSSQKDMIQVQEQKDTNEKNEVKQFIDDDSDDEDFKDCSDGEGEDKKDEVLKIDELVKSQQSENDLSHTEQNQVRNSFVLIAPTTTSQISRASVKPKRKFIKNPSNPLENYEPLTTLERLCEIFVYNDLLTSASKQTDKFIKLCYISAFIISSLSLSINRFMKPFTPILGETFEYVGSKDHFRFISEHVSHDPLISAFIGENDYWAFYGDNRSKDNLKILKGANQTEFDSKYHFKIKSTNDYYTINKPTLLSKGLVIGATRFDFVGTTIISNVNDRSITSEITFIEESSKTRIGSFEGKVTENGTVKYLIKGNWTSYVYYCDPEGNNRVNLWKINEESYLNNNVNEEYNIPSISLKLNRLDKKLKESLPPTDSRLRPDLQMHEQYQDKKALMIKEKLEKKEEQRIEELENNNLLYQPNYFYEVFDQNSFDNVYIYKGGYWEDRKMGNYESLDKNIFTYI